MLAARDQRYSYCQRPPSMALRVAALDERVRPLEIDGRAPSSACRSRSRAASGTSLPGRAARVRIISLTCLYATRRTISVSIVRLREALAPARRRGSPRRRLRASASTSASSPAMRACGADPPRSCASVVMAIVQPSFSSADHVLARHAHVVEEHLVEPGDAGHLDERPDRDAGTLHVDQQEA